MTALFLEPVGGMAGDMLLAALLDLGDPRFALADLRALAAALVPGECRLELERVQRGSIEALRLEVTTPESAGGPERHLADLAELLERAPLSPRGRARSLGALRRLAEAEGRVHGIPPEEVHFHEVGAVDTLVDVAGAALALERLGVERVFATAPLAGEGTVRCAHGELPVPAPGTLEILRGRALRYGGGEGERTTPTGAALLVELVREFGPPRSFTPCAVGYGAGRRDPAAGPPNVLRAQLGELDAASGARRQAWLGQCHLDDATGEEIAFAAAELRAAGALDVWTHAVAMKKERPGTCLSLLCREPERAELERLLFAHTPTLGVRWLETWRTECSRESLVVHVRGREVSVKLRRRAGAQLSESDLSPEHDDLARLVRESGAPLRTLEREAVAAALDRLAQVVRPDEGEARSPQG